MYGRAIPLDNALRREDELERPYLLRYFFAAVTVYRPVIDKAHATVADAMFKDIEIPKIVSEAEIRRDLDPLYVWCKVNGYPLPTGRCIYGSIGEAGRFKSSIEKYEWDDRNSTED